MSPVLADRALRELGRTEGSAETLALLVRDQHTRRLLLLRALLDAAAGAPGPSCPPALLDRLHADWALLEAAERADPTAVRAVLLHPLAGPWAQRCLRGLIAAEPSARLTADLAHFSAIAASAAIRAGLPFSGRLTARDGLAVLPTLGALRCRPASASTTHIALEHHLVTMRQGAARPVVVRMADHGARSDDPSWLPVTGLPPLLPGGWPVPLDDLDPYRTAGSGPAPAGLRAVSGLDDGERKAWARAWSGVESLLRTAGEHRLTEASVLLRCLVPLAAPPGAGPPGGEAHSSGTRREAFGAVLSSRPSTPAYFASTLVHELQHTKLAALGDIAPLHHEDAAARHFAPWRPDPRPFDGLLQGAYSHLALADFWQRLALGARRATHRDHAWAEHSRCREQTGAVLPVLAGSGALTREGRIVVNEMIGVYHRLTERPPPEGHLARAVAYVDTARVIWRQRNDT